ncbi:hypothetical protein GQR58_026644 [Nymphon striatum]|nr:hypothetical protein GQR58_026644 [Nymphon striatum]
MKSLCSWQQWKSFVRSKAWRCPLSEFKFSAFLYRPRRMEKNDWLPLLLCCRSGNYVRADQLTSKPHLLIHFPLMSHHSVQYSFYTYHTLSRSALACSYLLFITCDRHAVRQKLKKFNIWLLKTMNPARTQLLEDRHLEIVRVTSFINGPIQTTSPHQQSQSKAWTLLHGQGFTHRSSSGPSVVRLWVHPSPNTAPPQYTVHPVKLDEYNSGKLFNVSFMSSLTQTCPIRYYYRSSKPSRRKTKRKVQTKVPTDSDATMPSLERARSTNITINDSYFTIRFYFFLKS